ncbi:neurotrypsin-like isoform X1 [Crassostrea virginica]
MHLFLNIFLTKIVILLGYFCSAHSTVSVRLVGGTMSRGRVDIMYNNTWGTICDDLFTNKSAGVLCHMLGFSRSGASFGGASVYGEASGPIWLDNLVCTGSETSITQCQFNGWGVHDCGHSEDVAITCSSVSVRLVGGTMSRGRVEIMYNNTWGTICDDSFTNKSAGVLCHMLGFSRSGAWFGASSVYREASGKIWLDDLVCTGSETSITQCQFNGWGVHDCGHSEDVAINCSSASVRLVGGTMSRGRVEILYNNTWGTICDDSFTNKSSGVLCHMLGFSRSGASFGGASVYGEASGTIWLDDLVCTGSETSITQCQFNGWGVHDCGHSEDVAINCSSAVSVRLVGGTMNNGRVEILHNNTWGTICDDAFTDQSAVVLCHMLGFNRSGAWFRASSVYGEASGTIWLDDLVCTGSETSITQCQSNGWGVHNCRHSEDVAITCSSDTKTSEDDERTEISSLYRLLFIVSSGFVAILLLVILFIVMYYKKNLQRKCSFATSTCTSDSLRNDNNTVYENVASNEQPRRADEEMYTELMF